MTKGGESGARPRVGDAASYGGTALTEHQEPGKEQCLVDDRMGGCGNN
jgi:hypothetical protein